MKKIIFVLSMLLLLAVVVAPYFFGIQAEKIYQQWVAHNEQYLKNNMPQTHLTTEHYQRGYFASSAQSRFYFDEKHYVNIDSKISHGPLIGWVPVLLRIHSELDFEPLLEQLNIKARLPEQWFTSEDIFTLNGGHDNKVRVLPYESSSTLEDSTFTFKLGGITIETQNDDYQKKPFAGDSRAEFGGLEMSFEGGSMSIEPFTLNAKLAQNNRQHLQGKLQASQLKLFMETDDVNYELRLNGFDGDFDYPDVHRLLVGASTSRFKEIELRQNDTLLLRQENFALEQSLLPNETQDYRAYLRLHSQIDWANLPKQIPVLEMYQPDLVDIQLALNGLSKEFLQGYEESMSLLNADLTALIAAQARLTQMLQTNFIQKDLSLDFAYSDNAQPEEGIHAQAHFRENIKNEDDCKSMKQNGPQPRLFAGSHASLSIGPQGMKQPLTKILLDGLQMLSGVSIDSNRPRVDLELTLNTNDWRLEQKR